MVCCLLCLEEGSSPAQKQIEIFSDEGLQLNICSIINKHFWLRPNSEQRTGQTVCLTCWETVRDFDQFYERVAEAHNHLDSKVTLAEDPLPHEVLLKSEEVSSTGQLVHELGDNFFDSEVKVEVNDLDLLPQIEIIDSANLSDRALRASRRERQMQRDNTGNVAELPKKIKLEPSLIGTETSRAELECELSSRGNLKTETKGDINESPSKLDTNDGEQAEPTKKRRGRPRKVKDETSTVEKLSQMQSQSSASSDNSIIKAEEGRQSVDEDNHDSQRDAPDFGESEDSASSSSESMDDNTDDSWPEEKPEQRYAEIPKKVVVKPKKYRKRPKPLVPPKRMTREEIERKNAQQAEYDKIIAKFFDKFSCPKCELLVQNFGEMRAHFRVSHGEEPGYMECCGRRFVLRKALAEHIYVHWNPEHWKCGTCGRVCQDSRALEVHESTHNPNVPEQKYKKVFQCDKCPKSFTTKAAFEYHSFSKHVPKSEFKFTCPECNKKLPTQRKLKDHMKYAHDPHSAVICDKCGKQLRTPSNLKKHHEVEHSETPRPAPVPMQCEICGTWLRHLSGLKQHMKSMHEDTGGEHRCPVCNKVSTTARALKRHIYHNHECERKFKCTMCEKAFKRPQDLREHISTHTGEVLYTCPNCPMTFFSNANMYKHRQRLHRAEWEADRKKPIPPNIMQQATVATAAMKMKQAVGAASAFFAHKAADANAPNQLNMNSITMH